MRVAEVAEGARASFDDGTTRPVARLIGADGVAGGRPSLRGAGPRPRFTGQVAWRATVPVADAPREAQIHMGPGRHLVCYPLRDGRSLNIVAVEERAAWTADGWSRTDDPENLRDAFSMFGRPVRESAGAGRDRPSLGTDGSRGHDRLDAGGVHV